MSAWTAEHRKRVGAVVQQEVDRLGNSARAAVKAGVSTKTIERIGKGDRGVAPGTLVDVAERLGLPSDEVLPPRPAREQTQLDHIEAMLAELLALARHDATPAALASAAAARIEAQPSAEPTVQPSRQGKGQAL